jgi:transposase-like protein
LSTRDRQAIVQAHTAGGVSLKELAGRFGVSDYSIRVVLAKSGVKLGRISIPPETDQLIDQLWRSGHSVAAIARQTGIAKSTLLLRLRTIESDQPTLSDLR